MINQTFLGNFPAEEFAKRLWGDIYFNPGDRKFYKKPANPDIPRTFVHFLLEPLYKIYSAIISQNPEELQVSSQIDSLDNIRLN